MIFVAPKLGALQYDGSNGAAIVAQLDSSTNSLVSDTGPGPGAVLTVSTIADPATPLVLNVGDWVIGAMTSATLMYGSEAVPGSLFNNRFAEFGGGPPVVATGSAAVPLLLAGASATVALTLDRPMDLSDSMSVVATGGPGVLTALVVTASSRPSLTGVSVTVQNTGLLSLSGAAIVAIVVGT